MDNSIGSGKVVPAIEAAEIDGRCVRIQWQDGLHSAFHFVWLRDNCLCDECGDPAIGRKRLRIADVPLDIAPTAVQTDGASVWVTWTHREHRSEYSSTWLRQNCYDDPRRREARFRPVLWDEGFAQDPPVLAFEEVVEDRGLLEMLRTVLNHGMCFIEGSPAEPGTMEALASRFGFVQENNFGRVQDLRVDPTRRSIANSFEALRVHTDEPYRASPPGILLFHCVATCAEGGGKSTFADGFRAAECVRAEDPKGFEALTANRQIWRRHFSGDVDVSAEFPILSLEEDGSLAGVRINDRVRAPARIDPDSVEDHYRGQQALLRHCEDVRFLVQRRLKPGDIAVFDNHRILHGRTELALKGERWLQWGQVEKGDLYSSLRILCDRVGDDRDERRMPRGAYS